MLRRRALVETFLPSAVLYVSAVGCAYSALSYLLWRAFVGFFYAVCFFYFASSSSVCYYYLGRLYLESFSVLCFLICWWVLLVTKPRKAHLFLHTYLCELHC